MTNLLSQRRTPPIDYRGVPLKYHPIVMTKDAQLVGTRPQISAVCRSMKDCENLVEWFGDAEFCPLQPVLLLIPQHPVLLCGYIPGAKYEVAASAAELKDDAVQLWGKYTQRINKTGSIVDFDELRERYGLPERSKVQELTAEAFHNRILAHKASPVTDPPRQPQYVRVNGKQVFAVDGLSPKRTQARVPEAES